MDRERLTELLEDPSQVAKKDLADLRSMAERFPWFSGAHLLLAVGEHETGDVLANDRSLPAAFVPSRSVLFDLVRKAEPPHSSALHVVRDEKPVPHQISEEASTAVSEAEPMATAAAVPPTAEDALPVAEQDMAPTTAVTHFPLDEALTPAKLEPAKAQEEVVPNAEVEVLERQMVEAIRSSGYDLRHLASTPPPPVERNPEPQLPSAAPADIRETSVSLPPPVSRPEPPVKAQLPGPHARLSFTEWLSQASEAQPEEAPTHASEPVQLATVATIRPEVTAEATPVLSQQEIMSHFIQHSTPAPTAEKAVFFNPQQAAKKSLLDDGLVSETLARIHEKQGNFTKAREVYDRLAVKHPEKSVYFAALSKALEGRSNK